MAGQLPGFARTDMSYMAWMARLHIPYIRLTDWNYTKRACGRPCAYHGGMATKRFQVQVATRIGHRIGPAYKTVVVHATDEAQAAQGVALALGLVAWTYEEYAQEELEMAIAENEFESEDHIPTHWLFVSEAK